MPRRKKVQPLEKTPDWGPRVRVTGIKQPNPDVNKWEFDERSNLGQQFGSQGTLFSVSKRPRNIPGPKGFSPERQDEVRRKTMIFADSVAMNRGGWLATDETGWLTSESAGRRRRATRDVQDLISRTTAPLPEKDGLDVKVVQDDDNELRRGGDESGYTSAAGFYRNPVRGGGHAAVVVAAGSLDFENRRSHTLTHELGHAHSWDTGRESARYETRDEQGREEAYADDFAVTHMPRLRRMAPNYRKPYPTGNRGDHFREAYDGARTTPITFGEALQREHANPNLPDGGRIPNRDREVTVEGGFSVFNTVNEAELDEKRFRENNPTLPGMEDARQYTAKNTYVDRDYGRLKGYERPIQYQNRVLNRQTQAIRDQLAGR